MHPFASRPGPRATYARYCHGGYIGRARRMLAPGAASQPASSDGTASPLDGHARERGPPARHVTPNRSAFAIRPPAHRGAPADPQRRAVLPPSAAPAAHDKPRGSVSYQSDGGGSDGGVAACRTPGVARGFEGKEAPESRSETCRKISAGGGGNGVAVRPLCRRPLLPGVVLMLLLGWTTSTYSTVGCCCCCFVP